jgi:hypothetical protein
LHTVLFDIPNRVMLRMLAAPPAPGLARRAARRAVQLTAEKMYIVGQNLGKVLIRRWPNIAAPHVALLLSPPAE